METEQNRREKKRAYSMVVLVGSLPIGKRKGKKKQTKPNQPHIFCNLVADRPSNTT